MKEYIERVTALNALIRALGYCQCANDVITRIPAADVAEVVRCKDCRYYPTAKVNEKGFLICPASGMEITETDYCSYGARMDKEDEHEVS